MIAVLGLGRRSSLRVAMNHRRHHHHAALSSRTWSFGRSNGDRQASPQINLARDYSGSHHRRFIHATTYHLIAPTTANNDGNKSKSNNSSAFARITKSNATVKQSGFEELIHNSNNKRNNKRRRDVSNGNNFFQEASSSSLSTDRHNNASEEDWLEEDGKFTSGGSGVGAAGGGVIAPLEERNSNILDDYDFGYMDEESQLQSWHRSKEEEFHTLSSKTNSVLAERSDNHEAIISQMQEWNEFLSTITSELQSLSDFRRKNPMYPPSEFMSSITYDAAEKVEGLLAHLIGVEQEEGEGGGKESNVSPPPEVEVTAYKLAMTSWSYVFSPQSGDRCETILEHYGMRFGGDMNYMPTMDAYTTVQEAHLKSCSSSSSVSSSSSSSVSSSAPAGAPAASYPGAKALDVLTLLTNIHADGDMFLKPNMALYSHTIAAVRNTLLDWQSRRRLLLHKSNEKRPQNGDQKLLENELAEGLLDALKRMELSMEEEIAKNTMEDGRVRLPLQQWYLAIRAYADGVATVARIPNIGNNDEKMAINMMAKLENFIATNATNIVLSVEDDHTNKAEDGSNTPASPLLEDIQRIVEESYANALSSRFTLCKEKVGHFPSFHNALQNAMDSDEMFERMKHRSNVSPSDINFLFPPPTPNNYRALIECWCECVRRIYSNDESNTAMSTLEEWPHAKAQSLLQQLEVQMAGRPIDGELYAQVIWAWGQVLNWPAIYRQNDYYFAANAVDELLHRTMTGYENGSVIFPWQLTVTKMCNFVFRLNSKIFKGGEVAMKRSLKLLDQMEHWHKQSDGAIAKPDTFSFGLILKTIANSGVPSSAEHAEAILQRMEESFGVKPRERHYLGVIRAYSRVRQRDVTDPRKAEAILQKMKERYFENKSVKPNTAIYSACISAYGGSKEYNSPLKVMELFEELQGLYDETGDEDFKPDSMMYASVLDAISKSKTGKKAIKGGDSSLRLAIQMLGKMEMSHDAGDIETGPNRYAYTNLLHAISQSRVADGVSLGEDMMRRMENRSRELKDESIRPDTQAYTTLIQIFAQRGDSESVEYAQKWFKQMEREYEDEGRVGSKPNKVTYTALINCWRKSGLENAGVEAENILSRMEHKYSTEGDLDLKPDAYVYAGAVDAWARSKSNDKAVRAWNIYQLMKRQYSNGNMDAKPNNVIITSIIKACGYTRGGREKKQKALLVLLECLAELKAPKYIIPTPITYRSLLNAAKALVADDAKRQPIAATIFEACCRNGQLDKTVLEALQNTQPELYMKLPGEIPSKWKRNVAKV